MYDLVEESDAPPTPTTARIVDALERALREQVAQAKQLERIAQRHTGPAR